MFGIVRRILPTVVCTCNIINCLSRHKLLECVSCDTVSLRAWEVRKTDRCIIGAPLLLSLLLALLGSSSPFDIRMTQACHHSMLFVHRLCSLHYHTYTTLLHTFCSWAIFNYCFLSQVLPVFPQPVPSPFSAHTTALLFAYTSSKIGQSPQVCAILHSTCANQQLPHTWRFRLVRFPVLARLRTATVTAGPLRAGAVL